MILSPVKENFVPKFELIMVGLGIRDWFCCDSYGLTVIHGPRAALSHNRVQKSCLVDEVAAQDDGAVSLTGWY